MLALTLRQEVSPPLEVVAPASASSLATTSLSVHAQLRSHQPGGGLREAHLVLPLPLLPALVPATVPATLHVHVPALVVLVQHHPHCLRLPHNLLLGCKPPWPTLPSRSAQGRVLNLLKVVLERLGLGDHGLHGAGDLCLQEAPFRSIWMQLSRLCEFAGPRRAAFSRIPSISTGVGRRGRGGRNGRALRGRAVASTGVQVAQHLP
mmetsp:Transcript_22806/g.51803  ORF Transcript_22806/g.51803 Transcript_22806/m.51803 type:complete len:206 (+) Transcript_22806:560-1177(+)